jgi:hypothetical protein
MVVEFKRTQSESPNKIWIPDSGTFNELPWEFCQGSLYRLSTESLQHISDACEFTARFQSTLVNSAYLDLVSGNATFVLEISKNSRPADIAVRYSRGQWTSNEVGRSVESRKTILKTSYQANPLTTKAIAIICDELNILEQDFPRFVIRVNFKAETATLIVNSVDANELPSERFCAFTVAQGNVSLAPIEIGEDMSPAPLNSHVTPVGINKDANLQLTSDSWKYSTYSQSEVDRLLKIQAENITTAFAAKISNQQRIVQETIAEHEKSMRKISAELYVEMEQFNSAASKAANDHGEKLKTVMEKTQNEMEVEFEQVKADLDRTLMNDLKSVDKRLQSLESTMQSLTETKQSFNSSQAILLLIALSIVLSLANVVMLFVHH